MICVFRKINLYNSYSLFALRESNPKANPFFKRFYVFIFRERERKGDREGEKY